MGGYFTKYHPPYHHKKMHATYLYMENALLKIYHKIVHEWANSMLTPIHTVAIAPNCTSVQGCANVTRMYGHTNTKTVT